MATKFGVEAVSESVAATLQAHLAGELTTVWAGWADGATVPQPVFAASNILSYGLLLPAVYPALFVEAMAARVTLDAAPNWQQMEYTLRLSLGLGLDKLDVIQRQMMRAMEAVRRVIVNQPQADGTVSGWLGMTPLRCQFSEVAKHPNGAFFQWGAWEVLARVEASY